MTDILIVEDDKELADLLTDFLREEGYVVSSVNSGERAVHLFERYGARLVVLDINLPDMNGYDLGADDYIEKPYDIDVLIAKIKGIFKRRYQHDILSADGVTLNLADKTAAIDGKSVELPSKEFDLLALLIENQGKVLKKEYLFGTVWGSDSDSEMQTLHVHINRIRQKLGDNPKNAKRLLTIWGVGYKFV